MKEIEPGIFLINEKGFKKFTPPVNLYLIAGPDGLLFDGGYGHRKAVRSCVSQVHEIERILGTRGQSLSLSGILPSHSHGDHFAGLVPLRRALKAPVILTEPMSRVMRSGTGFMDAYWSSREWAPPRHLLEKLRRAWDHLAGYLRYKLAFAIHFVPDPDRIIPDSGVIMAGGEPWQVIPTPGHARDHISLYNEKRGILLGGDLVLRTVTTWLGPPNSNLDEYRATLEGVLALPGLRLILPAHGSPVTDPAKRINEILAWRERRFSQVRAMVERHGPEGVTVKTILDELYPDSSSAKAVLARGWVELTLQSLEREGFCRSRFTGGRRLYTRCDG